MKNLILLFIIISITACSKEKSENDHIADYRNSYNGTYETTKIYKSTYMTIDSTGTPQTINEETKDSTITIVQSAPQDSMMDITIYNSSQTEILKQFQKEFILDSVTRELGPYPGTSAHYEEIFGIIDGEFIYAEYQACGRMCSYSNTYKGYKIQ